MHRVARGGSRVRTAADREAGTARVETRPLAHGERDALLAWLDGGLRGGRAGRLLAETPHALSDASAVHAVARCAGRPVSHAFGRIVLVRAAGRSLRVGTIGLVYSDPALRMRGLARACVGALADRLTADGAQLLALWSDRGGLYASLGFRRAGTEWRWAIDAATCRAARAGAEAIDVGPPRAHEWTALEALYDAKPARADRASGDLARAAGAAECAT
ncbi:MAG: hypothetical protein DCC71_21905, partial [Proteobacteria bacterium]